MDISNGIAIVRTGDIHPNGREDLKKFEYREGQPLGTYFGKVLEQVFLWAQDKGVSLQDLSTNTPQLRQLVELSGGKVERVQA